MSELPRDTASLSLEEKRALVERLLRERSLKPKQYPLSFAQERLWFIDQLEPGLPGYNIPMALRLSGALDVAALERSLTEIVRRHESFRTTFRAENGRPLQIVGPPWTLSLIPVEAPGETQEQRRLAGVALARAEAMRPFDLSCGPLLRALLLRMDREEHLFVLTMHHIVSDGWSQGVFSRELTILYDAFSKGQPSPLSPLPIQYADYTVWQRKYLRDETLECQLRYWRKQLAGVGELRLPMDRPRPLSQTFDGASERIVLSKALTEKLKQLSQRADATLFMTLLSAFQVMLYRYTGQEDFATGSPIANRNRTEIEGLIGFFVNTLVLRADLSGHPAFREVLARVRTMALDAYGHQDVPFERLVEELRPERDLSKNPFFQVLFTFQNAPAMNLVLSGIEVRSLSDTAKTTRFDIELYTWEFEESIHSLFVYNTNLFDTETIQRMTAHWRVLLEGIVTNPETRIGALPLMTPEESALTLSKWNETAHAWPPGMCAHHFFEAQAARTPDAPAAMRGEISVSYRDLDRLANAVAARLSREGAGSGTLAGVFLDRSFEMLAAVLGILKAGAAYVPLDPDYPAERIQAIISDAAMPVILTRASMAAQLPETAARLLCFEELAPSADSFARGDLSEDSLAYVLYTSGSTGRPKGVAMPHRALANLIHWQCAHSAMGLGSRTLQFASLNFDVSFQEMFSTWAAGGALVLVDEFTRRDPAALLRLIARDSIERLFLPFVALHHLAEAADQANVETLPLREVITAGEALQCTRALRSFFERLPHCALWNHYGPTEAHVVTAHRLEGHPDTWPASPPIGRPIANVTVYVLDANGQPVPAGVHGELYLGGRCLANGYLNRPDLTRERFVPNPFSGDPEARLYRTGDVVRFQPDGTIDFIGRSDGQIKIRGYRIELGEIEWALQEHPEVREAAVTAREEESGTKQLVAYLVAQTPAPAPQAVQEFLRNRLPGYMVPNWYVFLDAFPMTPSGKVDRNALPEPEWTRGGAGATYIAPRNETESHLAAIWQEVLRVAQVGIEDDFFALGGHSLPATRVMARIQETMGVSLPLRTIFQAPVLHRLAAHIDEARHCRQRGDDPALSPAPRDGNLELSFAQQRLWVIEQLHPGAAVYNLPVPLQLLGRLEVDALERALREEIRRHETLRTIFVNRGENAADGAPEVTQRILSDPGFVLQQHSLETVDSDAREDALQRLLREESWRPFDLAQEIPFRAVLVRQDSGKFVLLLVFHHICTDGWSLRIFFEELSALYTAYTTDTPSPLPDLTIHYADFAAWQRLCLRENRLAALEDYWKTNLAGALPLELPTDHPRPPIQRLEGANLSLTLSPDLSDAIRTLSQRHGATLYMTLLTAFKALLYRYAGQEDLVVGTPVSHRNRPELERVIGLFVNTLALRTDLGGDPSFLELLQRVKRTVLEAFDHAGLPFDRVIALLNPERDRSRRPLVQAAFDLQPISWTGAAIGAVSATPLPVHDVRSPLDLELHIIENPDGLLCRVGYPTALFEHATLQRFLAHWHTLLEGIVAAPDARISRLPLLTEPERRRILFEWNNTVKNYGGPSRIHELFEAQAAQHPDREACEYDGRLWTYRELNQRANQLARYLAKRGVANGTLVGVCMDSGPEMILAILAILKAGGAYLPLDPHYPADRLAFMLKDSGATLVVSTHALAPRLNAGDISSVMLDSDAAAIGGEAETNPNIPGKPEDLAYVIYTSGSTGTPKGVLIEHRAVCNLSHAIAEQRGISCDDRVLLTASLNFDASVIDLFSTLCHGAALIVPRRDAHGLFDLSHELTAHAITSVTLAPPSLLLTLREPAAYPQLNRIIVAADVCPPALVRQWRDGRRFFNEYGPTEATVCATLYDCAEDSCDAPPPIGRPMGNMRCYIVDGSLNPVPVGVPGELLIGGAGVARGYLNRPELTNERFLQDPFGSGGKVYRTGDRCRYRPDGVIEFLGRTDEQVKVRGFRVELGEIETALRRHPSVKEAAVLAVPEQSGGKRLIAYILLAGPLQEFQAVLHDFLAARMPHYALPSAWIALDDFPRMPNGKLDRNALPLPGADAARPADTQALPATPLEKWLAALWESVLGVTAIGVHDDFFAVGGSSLTAAICTNRLQKALGEYVYVTGLYETPTIAQYAATLRKNYGPAVQRLCPGEEVAASASEQRDGVSAAEEALFRQRIAPMPPFAVTTPKNPSAVFVLSPTRSGSTLLRVMLEGHPALFAPPELMLLSFNDTQSRRDAYTGRFAYWLEGTVRALMEAFRIDVEEAKQRMEHYERQNLSVKELYRILQNAIAPRLLVDKSPLYCLHPDALARLEDYFDNARYIHLIRHPLATIASFEEARLDETFPHPEGFTRHQLAELVWLVSHKNILEFLRRVPEERKTELRFERMVRQPKEEMERLCAFLGIPFDDALLKPYSSTRMTDAVHPESRMLGDIKFHTHKNIDASVAERWKKRDDILGEPARELAATLGYAVESPRASRKAPWPPTLVPLRIGGKKPPLFIVAPAGGTVFPYFALAKQLGADQPVYALLDPGTLPGASPCATVEEMAAHHVRAIHAVRPEGPFHLAGWSFGGLVAFETAQQLRAAGTPPAMLGLIETRRATKNTQRKSYVKHPKALFRILYKNAVSFTAMARDLFYILWAFHNIAPEGARTSTLLRLSNLGRRIFLRNTQIATVVTGEKELLGIRQPTPYGFFRTVYFNMKTGKRYTVHPYPHRVDAFLANEMLTLPQESELSTILGNIAPESDIVPHVVQGDHWSIFRYPNVVELAEALRAAMAETIPKTH